MNVKYSSSTIGFSIMGLKESCILWFLLYVCTLPELILTNTPSKDLTLQKFPYPTMVLASSKLPVIFVNIVAPFIINRFLFGSSYKKILKESTVVSFLLGKYLDN